MTTQELIKRIYEQLKLQVPNVTTIREDLAELERLTAALLPEEIQQEEIRNQEDEVQRLKEQVAFQQEVINTQRGEIDGLKEKLEFQEKVKWELAGEDVGQVQILKHHGINEAIKQRILAVEAVVREQEGKEKENG